jgi:hypothetical protein
MSNPNLVIVTDDPGTIVLASPHVLSCPPSLVNVEMLLGYNHVVAGAVVLAPPTIPARFPA